MKLLFMYCPPHSTSCFFRNFFPSTHIFNLCQFRNVKDLIRHQCKTKRKDCDPDYINLEVEELLHVILNNCPSTDSAIDYFLNVILICDCKPPNI